MKITEKTLMCDFNRLATIFNMDANFKEKVKIYDIPGSILDETPKNVYDIQIQYIMEAWNAKEGDSFIELTKKAFELKKDINEYPLIDYCRLVYALQDTAVESAKYFSSLKRKDKNPKIQSILKKYSTSDLGLIDRFVIRCNGAYTHEQAEKVGWFMVYTAFKEDTDKYDMQVEISESMK